MGHLGSDAVAANGIANIVRNLVACFCLDLGSGSGIIVGNELGAGQLAAAKEYGRKLCKLTSTRRAATVAMAAPAIPILGQPAKPKIRMAFKIMFITTHTGLITLAFKACSPFFRMPSETAPGKDHHL